MKLLKFALLVAILIAAISTARAQHPADPGKFDFYLLNLSWSPEFCATHANASECKAHLGFILHGLWGENADGSYPYHCAGGPGPAHPESYADITPDPGLIRHEWDTHGVCSGLGPDAFFSLARKAFHKVAIPPELTNLDHELLLPPSEILGMFAKANPSFPAGSLILSCGNNRLTAIEACMSKSLAPMACPAAVRSCRANQVKVTPQK